jgi:hypothetical protein
VWAVTVSNSSQYPVGAVVAWAGAASRAAEKRKINKKSIQNLRVRRMCFMV